MDDKIRPLQDFHIGIVGGGKRTTLTEALKNMLLVEGQSIEESVPPPADMSDLLPLKGKIINVNNVVNLPHPKMMDQMIMYHQLNPKPSIHQSIKDIVKTMGLDLDVDNMKFDIEKVAFDPLPNLVDFDFASLYPTYMPFGKRKLTRYERRVRNRQRLYEKLKKLGRRL